MGQTTHHPKLHTHTSHNMPTASSLGGINAAYPIAPPRAPAETTPLPAPSLASRTYDTVVRNVKMPSLRGFVPLLLYSLFAAALPFMYFYGDYDYTEDMTRAGVIVLSALLGFVVLMANDCCTWYNMALFFHTAVEVRLLDTTIAVATGSTSSDADVFWSWVGAVVVIVHLLPFFLVDSPMTLALALVGVPVNAALAVYRDVALLPIVVPSAAGFFLIACIVLSVNQLQPSMLTKLRAALAEGTWIQCA
jgi:hypothetical protein